MEREWARIEGERVKVRVDGRREGLAGGVDGEFTSGLTAVTSGRDGLGVDGELEQVELESEPEPNLGCVSTSDGVLGESTCLGAWPSESS